MPETLVGYAGLIGPVLASAWGYLGPIFGVVIGWWLKEKSEKKEKAREKANERGAAATLLMHEICEQGRMVAMAASYFNWAAKGMLMRAFYKPPQN